MEQRKHKWMAGNTSNAAASGWENEFKITDSDIVDLRFTLEGYGWKSGADVENKIELRPGVYKVYYREA